MVGMPFLYFAYGSNMLPARLADAAYQPVHLV